MTKLVCISDTHTLHGNIILPKGDVLVHSGDFTGQGELRHYRSLSNWLVQQADTKGFQHIVIVPGNHDLTFESMEDMARSCFDPAITILIGQEVTLDGVKFYGAPHTPEFYSWAFNVERDSDKMRAVWDKIPTDTDVLITHGPPFGILDRNSDNFPCGCKALSKAVHTIQPKVHVYGHIHEGYGTTVVNGTTFVNASTCDGNYRPINKPIVVDV